MAICRLAALGGRVSRGLGKVRAGRGPSRADRRSVGRRYLRNGEAVRCHSQATQISITTMDGRYGLAIQASRLLVPLICRVCGGRAARPLQRPSGAAGRKVMRRAAMLALCGINYSAKITSSGSEANGEGSRRMGKETVISAN